MKIYIPVAISMGVVILFSHIIFSGNHPEFELLTSYIGIRIYWERLRDATIIYFRVLPMIFTMVFFLSTSRERDIIVAMRSIKIPFVVTYIFAMALRSAGMVLEDFQIIRQAEQARGYDPQGKSIPYKIKQYVMYMVPLFALSIRRSEEFTNALVARGYSFAGKKSNKKRADFILTHYSYKYFDYLFIGAILVIFCTLLILRYSFNYFGMDHSWILRFLYNVVS
jgi:energy-coupling factor transporter transmembrane protein EcfT